MSSDYPKCQKCIQRLLASIRGATPWVVLSIVGLVTTTANAADERFEMIVLGDSQSYLTNNGQFAANFQSQVDWIRDNKQLRNIKFISHVGDLVEHPDTLAEWNLASDALAVLDQADIANAVAFGNHESTTGSPGNPPPQVGATNYLDYFGADRYSGHTWFGGASPTGLSSWQRINAGGGHFLHVNLEYDAPDAALEWAQSVLDMPGNQGLPTVVTTHVYLNDNRGIFNNGNKTTVLRQTSPYDSSDPSRNSAETIFNEFISANDQIFLTLNGHVQGERLLVSKNDAGSDVYQMQVDYSRRPNGGDGWTRILTFDVNRHQIRVSTYSPVLDDHQQVEPSNYLGRDDSPYNEPVDHYTGPGDTQADGDAEYVITLDFFDRFGLGHETALPFGDLNEDGVIDAGDWSVFSENHLSDMSALNLGQTYLRGDLDEDGDNDEVDYQLFKTLYEQANGPNSLERISTTVPEPMGAILWGIGGAAYLAQRHLSTRSQAAERR
ncbi:hypothetical protein [Aeoliella sp.]|uniref:hypothetical protein n=1 Tax=Aeoliella sp. TaxID=2795800 RepID=UPI003CCB8A32